MPVFKIRKIFEIAQGTTCFVRLEFGIIRGQVPEDDAQVPRQVQQLKRHRKNAREGPSRTKPEPSRRQARAARSKTTREKPDGVVYDGVLLPPPNLRPTRRRRIGEQVYFEATRREVDWMVDNLGLSTTSSLLDLGCGSGRIPPRHSGQGRRDQRVPWGGSRQTLSRMGPETYNPRAPEFSVYPS
jgi:hypothetical protein